MAEPAVDLAVVGGGPAGVATALAAASAGLAVRVLEASDYDGARPGETLSPSARPVLERLDLAAVADAAALPAYGFESAWGDDELVARPTMLGPYGPGWHLDRPRFDAALALAAERRGVAVDRRAAVTACAAAPGGWELTAGAGRTLRARVVVDATGRRARLARRLGAHRRVHDHLVGIAATIRAPAESRSMLVEAVPDGWWYTAPVGPERQVAVLMTDADLCRADPDAWARALGGTRHVAARLGSGDPDGVPSVVAAVSQRLERAARGPWLATGDAALAVDPLSGSGLLGALLSGEAAGLAAAALVRGHARPADDYERWLDARFAAYLEERQAYYALETRWPDAPFWQRRVPAPLDVRPVDPLRRDGAAATLEVRSAAP